MTDFLTETLRRVRVESARQAGYVDTTSSYHCRKMLTKRQRCSMKRLRGYAFCAAHLREYRELVGRGESS